MNNVFFTGKVQIGKTTLIKKFLSDYKFKTGGFMTHRVSEDNLTEFIVYSPANSDISYKIAKIINRPFEVNVYEDAFEEGVAGLIKDSLEKSDIIILDELGHMESNCKEFKDAVLKALDSSVPVLGVLKAYDCEFLNLIKMRDDVTVIEVTENNRDIINLTEIEGLLGL